MNLNRRLERLGCLSVFPLRGPRLPSNVKSPQILRIHGKRLLRIGASIFGMIPLQFSNRQVDASGRDILKFEGTPVKFNCLRIGGLQQPQLRQFPEP